MTKNEQLVVGVAIAAGVYLLWKQKSKFFQGHAADTVNVQPGTIQSLIPALNPSMPTFLPPRTASVSQSFAAQSNYVGADGLIR